MSSNIHLLDMIDKSKLDEVLAGFTAVTGISSFIVDPEGKPISRQHNWSRLCSDYCRSTEEGRRRCFESDRYGGQVSAKLKKRFIYPCLNAGLIDCTAPIIVGSFHIATFMCGQVLHKPISESDADRHAREIGVRDIDGYKDAIRNVPIVSNARLNTIVDFLEVVTKTISELAWNKYISSIKSRRYLDRLVNRVSDGIMSLDSNGRIFMVNDALSRLVGASKDQIIGRHFSHYLSDDDSTDPYDDIIEQARQKGHCRASLRILDAGGETLPVQVTFSDSGDVGGDASYVAVLRDMTEEMKIAQFKEDLIGMMTHDLGNPVISIQRAMQLLSSGVLGPLNPGQEELIKLSLNTTRQLSGMVMDYLDIYRHENGRMRLRKEILDLDEIIRESVKQVEFLATERKVEIGYDAGEAPLYFMGDRMRMGPYLRQPAGQRGQIQSRKQPDRSGKRIHDRCRVHPGQGHAERLSSPAGPPTGRTTVCPGPGLGPGARDRSGLSTADFQQVFYLGIQGSEPAPGAGVGAGLLQTGCPGASGVYLGGIAHPVGPGFFSRGKLLLHGPARGYLGPV